MDKLKTISIEESLNKDAYRYAYPKVIRNGILKFNLSIEDFERRGRKALQYLNKIEEDATLVASKDEFINFIIDYFHFPLIGENSRSWREHERPVSSTVFMRCKAMRATLEDYLAFHRQYEVVWSVSGKANTQTIDVENLQKLTDAILSKIKKKAS